MCVTYFFMFITLGRFFSTAPTTTITPTAITIHSFKTPTMSYQ